MPKHAIEIKLVAWALIGFALLVVLLGFHGPWIVHQIKKPVYADICAEGVKQGAILEMAYANNLEAAEDAHSLYSIRIAAGDGSIPIQNLRVFWQGKLIDLGEHPAWQRVIMIMRVQDSAANVVLLHNLSYCNKPEPWAIWHVFHKHTEPQRFPVNNAPEGIEVAEVTEP